jgi:hypothetical protein
MRLKLFGLIRGQTSGFRRKIHKFRVFAAGSQHQKVAPARREKFQRLLNWTARFKQRGGGFQASFGVAV